MRRQPIARGAGVAKAPAFSRRAKAPSRSAACSCAAGSSGALRSRAEMRHPRAGAPPPAAWRAGRGYSRRGGAARGAQLSLRQQLPEQRHVAFGIPHAVFQRDLRLARRGIAFLPRHRVNRMRPGGGDRLTERGAALPPGPPRPREPHGLADDLLHDPPLLGPLRPFRDGHRRWPGSSRPSGTTRRDHQSDHQPSENRR